MDLTSIIRAIISPMPEKPGFKVETLKPGDTLQGTILGARKGGKTLVDFGTFRVFAEIKFPISAGEVLRVKVIESGEQLMLKLIDKPSRWTESHPSVRGYRQPPTAQSLNSFRSALTGILHKNESLPPGEKLPPNIRDAMVAINTHFEPFDFQGEMAKLIGQLKSRVQGSGIFFEKLLEDVFSRAAAEKPDEKPALGAQLQSLVRADIKPNLQILREFINQPANAHKYFDAKEVESIKNTVNGLFADVIDQQNAIRIAPQEPDSSPFFTYLLNLKDSDQLGKLRVYYAPTKKADSSRPPRISVLLDMDKLGQIRSDISLFDHEIHIQFFVVNAEIKHRIEENLTELKTPLAALFKNLVLTVSVSQSRIEDFTRQEVKQYTNTKVDIRV